MTNSAFKRKLKTPFSLHLLHLLQRRCGRLRVVNVGVIVVKIAKKYQVNFFQRFSLRDHISRMGQKSVAYHGFWEETVNSDTDGRTQNTKHHVGFPLDVF